MPIRLIWEFFYSIDNAYSNFTLQKNELFDVIVKLGFSKLYSTLTLFDIGCRCQFL